MNLHLRKYSRLIHTCVRWTDGRHCRNLVKHREIRFGLPDAAGRCGSYSMKFRFLIITNLFERHILVYTTMFAAATRSSLLRSSTLVQSVYTQRCFASSLASSVKSLEGVHFMSIDQLRYVLWIVDFGVLNGCGSRNLASQAFDDAVCFFQ